MLREKLIEQKVGAHEAFRWRGEDVSRLESLTDAAFGFALTLIVVSLEGPKTFGDLLQTLLDAGSFGLCFAVLISIWFKHYHFFRRYGLQDGVTAVLNTVMLFIVLLYIYPIKFLFTLLGRQFFGLPVESMIREDQVGQLFIVYGVGFIALYVVFALMYMNAYRQRDKLALTVYERFQTLEGITGNLSLAGIGVLSIAIAAFGGAENVAFAGWIYFLIPVILTASGYGIRFYRQRITVAQP